MDIDQVKELLHRYRNGDCTDSEKRIVEDWYDQLYKTGEWQWSGNEINDIQNAITEIMTSRIEGSKKKKTRFIYKAIKFHWWAAALVCGIIITVGYLIITSGHESQNVVKSNILSNDVVAPQENRATITLANGKKVFLDSVGNGTLAIQKDIRLVKLSSGQIVYEKASLYQDSELQYNTLSNPRGSRVIKVTLSDGSKVWLNAGSSLTYPVSFIGNERSVSVEGETYFEVKHDDNKLFVVKSGDTEIKVLGTHFNINAFKDDGQNIKVTLLQGSVAINSNTVSHILKPGEQAQVGNTISIVKDIDLNMVVAWKNGFFQFDHASLKDVMNQISRWYDIDVIYENGFQQREFVGEIQRDLLLSEVIKVLEKSGVKFKITGKKLIVK